MRKPGINGTVGVVLLVISFAIAAPLLYGATQLVKGEHAQAATGGGGGGAGGGGGPVSVTVDAQNIAFSVKTITASPGADVSVTFNNKDAGVLHNIAFYTNRAATSEIKKGGLLTGPASETITFKAPSTPGNYFFRCDVHPDQMTGTFTVK